jgi:hypothetical protein
MARGSQLLPPSRSLCSSLCFIQEPGDKRPASNCSLYFMPIDSTLALFQGGDASILIDSTAGNQAEKDAISNLSMNPLGYEVVHGIKAALEAACPRTVTCADIIALGGREAVFQVGDGPPLPFLHIYVWLRRQGPEVVGEMTAALEEVCPPFAPREVCGYHRAKAVPQENYSQPVTSDV